jgi:hypothetical protein
MSSSYIGVKMISAVPMTRLAYNELRGWAVPDNEDPTDDGYLVEYHDGGVANHAKYAGYISWSPKDVFARSYRSTSGMNFGLAVEAMKSGRKVARDGWNGKGIFIELQVPDAHSKMTSPYIFIDTTGLQSDNPSAPRSRVPWLASQTDMLADDWVICE